MHRLVSERNVLRVNCKASRRTLIMCCFNGPSCKRKTSKCKNDGSPHERACYLDSLLFAGGGNVIVMKSWPRPSTRRQTKQLFIPVICVTFLISVFLLFIYLIISLQTYFTWLLIKPQFPTHTLPSSPLISLLHPNKMLLFQKQYCKRCLSSRL